MKYVALLMVHVFLLTAVVGCASFVSSYQAQNITEWMQQAKATGANGCFYVRGNARPYADVSMVYIAAYGEKAPKYLECLNAIPESDRALAAPAPTPGLRIFELLER